MGRVMVVMDLQAGSCGKGKFIAWLAGHNGNPMVGVDNFMTNAGHTFVTDDGRKVVTQHVPSSIINPNALLLIGPGAAISMETLNTELIMYGDLLGGRTVYIHPRAMVIQPEHAEKERQIIKSGSTFKGCGAACADKIMRVPGVKLFKDVFVEGGIMQKYDGIMEHCAVIGEDKFVQLMHTMIHNTQVVDQNGENIFSDILIEGSQGFDLDINYGLDYPHVTSRQCNASQLVADCGIPPWRVTDVFGIMRPYPIRISNDSITGHNYTGDYCGAKEISWEEIKKRCGAPDDVEFGEMTTVTKKPRRVFEQNWHRIEKAIQVNEPTWVILNFAQYIDYSALGVTEWDKLPEAVLEYVESIQNIYGTRVAMVGTGPKMSEVCISPEFAEYWKQYGGYYD